MLYLFDPDLPHFVLKKETPPRPRRTIRTPSRVLVPEETIAHKITWEQLFGFSIQIDPLPYCGRIPLPATPFPPTPQGGGSPGGVLVS